ncbi:MAG TPA: BrnA antitoxin family protein [Stellaceae bacterium]|nr:BrnA antitoxin family protein [Stellaceae bacterium]
MGNRAKKPAEISQQDWDSVDVPEATQTEFATAKRFREAFPAQYEAWEKPGRPPVAAPKVHMSFRLAADVVEAVRASGRGYNARVEKVLRDALAKGEL